MNHFLAYDVPVFCSRVHRVIVESWRASNSHHMIHVDWHYSSMHATIKYMHMLHASASVQKNVEKTIIK